MADYDLHSNVLAVQAIPCATHPGDTPVVSAIIDTFCHHSLEFITNIGTLDPVDAGTTYTVLVEDGDDAALADAAAVDDVWLIGGSDTVTPEEQASFNGTHGNEVRRIGYVGKKRYVRYTITPASSTNADFSVTAVLGNPGSAPTAEN